MKVNEQRLRTAYICADYLSTFAGVMVFTLVRFLIIPEIRFRYAEMTAFLGSHGLKLTLAFFPLFMLGLYYLSGYYVNVTTKSRVKEFLSTLVSLALGSFIFFMVVLLNDVLPRRVMNYELLLIFFFCLFVPVYLTRLSLTTYFISKYRRSAYERVIVITDGETYPRETEKILERSGKRVAGIIDIASLSASGDGADSNNGFRDSAESCRKLRNALEKADASAFMVTFPDNNTETCLRVLGSLYPLDCPIYVCPDDFTLLTSKVTYENLLSEPLLDISRSSLSDSVVAIKRACDVVGATLGLIISAPVMAVAAVAIKLKSSGPVFFTQERVGYHRKPFRIHKFRTMRIDAESDGPRLSSDDDPRVTEIGRVMRKYRLDELPNLWNVLRGDMSLVGPRPEREYFLTRLHNEAPHCALLHQVRPGLTSLGMVKFGYASTLPDMVTRLKYDILYIQNISISLDLKIMFYTVRTLLRGEGK